MVGDDSVGKLSIINSYLKSSSPHTHLSIIGIEYFVKNVCIKNYQIKVIIWDTNEQHIYNTIMRSYDRGADAVIIIFDLSNQQTFRNVDRWINDKYNTMIIGTQSDTESKVSPEDINLVLKHHPNTTYIKISTDVDVDMLFETCLINCINSKLFHKGHLDDLI